MIDDEENVYKKYGYGNKGRNPAIKESNSDLEEDFIRVNLQNREFFLIIIVLV